MASDGKILDFMKALTERTKFDAEVDSKSQALLKSIVQGCAEDPTLAEILGLAGFGGSPYDFDNVQVVNYLMIAFMYTCLDDETKEATLDLARIIASAE